MRNVSLPSPVHFNMCTYTCIHIHTHNHMHTYMSTWNSVEKNFTWQWISMHSPTEQPPSRLHGYWLWVLWWSSVSNLFIFIHSIVTPSFNFSLFTHFRSLHTCTYIFTFCRMYTIPAHLKRDVFTLCCPETHVFPLVNVCSQNYLQVSVEYLPRLEQIPSILLPLASSASNEITLSEEAGALQPYYSQALLSYKLVQPCVSTSFGQSVVTGSSPNITKVPHRSPHKDIHQAVQVSPRGWAECFPFSPPLSSPLSPKMLSGLSDHEAYGANGLSPDQHMRSVGSGIVALPTCSLLPESDQSVSSSKQCDNPLAIVPVNASFLLPPASIAGNVNRATRATAPSQSPSVRTKHNSRKSCKTVSAGTTPCSSVWTNGVRPSGASSPVSFICTMAVPESVDRLYYVFTHCICNWQVHVYVHGCKLAFWGTCFIVYSSCGHISHYTHQYGNSIPLLWIPAESVTIKSSLGSL